MNDSEKLNDSQKVSQLMDGEWRELNSADCLATLCADKALQAKWARYHMIRDVLKNEPVRSDQALVTRICDAIKDEPDYSNITLFSGAGAVPVATATPSDDDVPVITKKSEVATPQQMQSPEPPTSIDSGSSWINTGVAGFALAASVALVTVVGLNLFQQETQPGVSQLASTDEGASQGVVQAGLQTNDVFSQDASTVLPVVEFVANTASSNSGSFWMSSDSAQRVSDEQRLNMMLSQHIENSPTAGRQGLLPYSRLVGYEENTQGR
ncbi:MAG: sigma-E factor negative regulatory protein [Granulosicoccus sp.]